MKAKVSESKSFQIWNKVQLLSCSVQFYPPWAPSASGRKGCLPCCLNRRMEFEISGEKINSFYNHNSCRYGDKKKALKLLKKNKKQHYGHLSGKEKEKLDTLIKKSQQK